MSIRSGRRFTAGLPALAGLLVMLASAVSGPLRAEQEPQDRDLRARVEARYEVVPLSRGIALRPRKPIPGVRLIEIADGTIALDGTEVSGRELRERLGTDADLVLRISYLDPQQQRALAAPPAPAQVEAPVEAPRDVPEVTPAEPPPPPPTPREETRQRHRVGERVRILGSVSVDRDEMVDGQVVAVMGSVRVDGHVTDQVVAVMGSVSLGPEARVDGDITAVGGRVNRSPGSVVRGSVREVAIGGPHARMDGPIWPRLRGYGLLVDPFARTARLLGTIFRALLLVLLVWLVVLVARDVTQRVAARVASEPVKMTLVGVLAQLLFLPLLFVVAMLLIVTVVGIPVAFLLVPLAIAGALLVAIVGFSGTSYAVGGWASTRTGWRVEEPYMRLALGVVTILLLLLIARLFGLIGGPFHLVALGLAGLALFIEFLAWAAGFGAAVVLMYERWQERRVRPVPPATTTAEPGTLVDPPPPGAS